jgi:hypothetical protein
VSVVKVNTSSEAEATPVTLRTAVDMAIVETASRAAARRGVDVERTPAPKNVARDAGLVGPAPGREEDWTTGRHAGHPTARRWDEPLPECDLG